MRIFCFVYFHAIYVIYVYQLYFRLLYINFLAFLSNQIKYFLKV